MATDIYAHCQVLSPEVAFLVKPEPEALARGIEEALKKDQVVREKVEAARVLFERQYARQAYKSKVSQLLDYLSKKK